MRGEIRGSIRPKGNPASSERNSKTLSNRKGMMKSLKRFTVCLLHSLFLIALTACTIPTATPMPGAAPTANNDAPAQKLYFDQWEYSCSGGTLTFTVRWTDHATDELGYRIFRNGEELVELPPNSTSYTDTLDVSAGETLEYYLQLFGPGGTENTSVMRMSC